MRSAGSSQILSEADYVSASPQENGDSVRVSSDGFTVRQLPPRVNSCPGMLRGILLFVCAFLLRTALPVLLRGDTRICTGDCTGDVRYAVDFTTGNHSIYVPVTNSSARYPPVLGFTFEFWLKLRDCLGAQSCTVARYKANGQNEFAVTVHRNTSSGSARQWEIRASFNGAYQMYAPSQATRVLTLVPAGAPLCLILSGSTSHLCTMARSQPFSSVVGRDYDRVLITLTAVHV